MRTSTNKCNPLLKCGAANTFAVEMGKKLDEISFFTHTQKAIQDICKVYQNQVLVKCTTSDHRVMVQGSLEMDTLNIDYEMRSGVRGHSAFK